jgi:hypothetical protein
MAANQNAAQKFDQIVADIAEKQRVEAVKLKTALLKATNMEQIDSFLLNLKGYSPGQKDSLRQCWAFYKNSGLTCIQKMFFAYS